MRNDTARADAISKIRDLIGGIEYAMLTTVREDGSLHSRPMAAQRHEFDGDLWFFTRASSHKVGDVEHDDRVNVTFAEPEEQNYLSLSGRASLVTDRSRIDELWHPALEAWFPDGPGDPDLGLLKVTVEDGEYWQGPSSTVAYTIGLARAVVTGEEYRPGENEEVKLDS